MSKTISLLAWAFLTLLLISACATTLEQPTSMPPLPSHTPSVTTTLPPTPTTALPTISTLAPAQNATIPPATAPQTVQIFLIVIGDNGQSGKRIGCGDSLVAVEVAIEPTTAVLRAALTELLNLAPQEVFGQSALYNALYLSTLNIDELNIIDRKALIFLSGELVIGGECDNPRIEQQLYETALQFSTIDEVEIYINNISLDQLLSLEG